MVENDLDDDCAHKVAVVMEKNSVLVALNIECVSGGRNDVKGTVTRCQAIEFV